MTAKQIDSLSIEEIEELANNLTYSQQQEWAEHGYDGKTYIRLTTRK